MLTWIRKKSSGLLMTFIMGLLILAFAIWGVQDYFTQSSNDTVAVVNGEKISINDYSQQFSQYRQNLMNQFGDGFDPSYFDSPQMKRSFLESMINNELFKQAAIDNGYVVTPAEIRAILEEAATFKDQTTGKFSPELYASFLSQTNQTASILQGKIVEGLIATAINDAVDLTTFTTPTEQNMLASLNLQTRNFDYLIISPSQFLDAIEATDEEIDSYYQENQDSYMTQPMVSVDYIELNAENMADELEISDQEALEYFEQNKAIYVKDEQRLASHILVNNSDESLNKINDIKKQLNEGADFAEIAKSESQDPGSSSNGGDLGWVNKGDMVPEFDEALFSMSVGSISEPVKTSFGYHLIYLKEIKEPEQAIFEEVKLDIVQALQAKKAENLFLDKASDVASMVLDAEDNLDSVAEESGLELKTTELFDRNSGVGLASNAEFREAAFSTLVKDDLQNSDVINISDTHIVFIHINENKDASLKPLEEVKSQVISSLKNKKAKSKSDEFANSLLSLANDDSQSLQEIADKNELTVVKAEVVKRTGSEHPFTLVKNVFESVNKNDDLLLLDSNGSDVALVDLKQVNEADLSTVDLKAESAQLNRNVKNNEQQLLIQALREKADIYVNEDMLNESGF